MSTCSLYIPRPVDPAREFYGVAQVNCGTCQQWDADREKCRQEAKLWRCSHEVAQDQYV